MLPCAMQGSSLQLASVLAGCGGNVARWCEALTAAVATRSAAASSIPCCTLRLL